jgi:predicted DNA-binding transcriptional regulator AlpA
MTLLTQREAALALRLSERTLERSRVTGFGPMFVKLGRRVFYRRSDLDEWIASHICKSTSERRPNNKRETDSGTQYLPCPDPSIRALVE